MTNLAAYKTHGCGTVHRKSKLRDSVLPRARAAGLGAEFESLSLGLTASVAVYDQILATVPSHVRPLVEGCGEKVIAKLREMLGAA